MASSYSTDLKLELMVTGENAGTWGDKTNTNLNLIQQAIAGVESIALTDGGTVTLVMSDASISNARNMVLKLTGTLTTASNLAIPDSIEKFYIIDATSVTGPTNLTVKTVSGTGFTLDAAKIYACYSDGTNITEVSLDTLGGTIGTASIADASITSAKISDNQITTAKISDNQITTAKISDNQITTAKISDNQVTADKLDDLLTDSGGTAGSYTTASITVDATGRITAASSGAAGGGDYLMTAFTSPGTFTPQPNTKAYKVTVVGGGGNGSPVNQNSGVGPAGGGSVGAGGGTAIEYLDAPSVTGPVSVTVGSGGSGGPSNQQGSPGGTSSFGAFCSATGGTGGANQGGTAQTSSGGVGSGGTFNFYGESINGVAANSKNGTGGSSHYGGGKSFGTGGTYGGGAGLNNNDPPNPGTYTANPFGGAGGIVVVEEFF